MLLTIYSFDNYPMIGTMGYYSTYTIWKVGLEKAKELA